MALWYLLQNLKDCNFALHTNFDLAIGKESISVVIFYFLFLSAMHRSEYERLMRTLPSEEEMREEQWREMPGCLVCKSDGGPRHWPCCSLCRAGNAASLYQMLGQRTTHPGSWSVGFHCGCEEFFTKPLVDLEQLGESKYRRALAEACLAWFVAANARCERFALALR
jgi:hypothetical protein